MSVIFIRKPSETPNIQNLDDIRMVRYAYGNQNGYIKGYGAELSHTATGSTFLINSGIFVIQGAEVKIDANGWSEGVIGVTNKRYYTVYGEVNLALQTAEIKSTYNHAAYPTIEASDDLTQVTDGTAREVLYRFTATNGIIADVVKVVKGIDYSTSLITSAINQEQQARENAIEQEQQARQQAITTERNARISAISAESNARQQQVNTINGRLDSLGFKTASITINNSAYIEAGQIYQLGKIIYGTIKVKAPPATGTISVSETTYTVATVSGTDKPNSRRDLIKINRTAGYGRGSITFRFTRGGLIDANIILGVTTASTWAAIPVKTFAICIDLYENKSFVTEI